MKKGNNAGIALKLALAAVFAGLVWIVTLTLVVSVPATSGYFNVGETVIYVAALLFGPMVGAFAGGIGASLADLMVAPPFAVGTLVIKGLEGAIVGFLNKKLFRQVSEFNWKLFTAFLGVIIGLLLAVIGSLYYSGEAQLYLGYPSPTDPTLTVFVPAEIWYFIGGIAALLIVYAGFKTEPELGRAVLSMLIGGLEMVFGYFLYEQLILGKTTAIIEIPVNIGQMLIGLVVAVPIAKTILRYLPQLKS